MTRRYDRYRDTPLWHILMAALAELEANREIAVSTASEYVVGYLCEQLDAARLTSPKALSYDP